MARAVKDPRAKYKKFINEKLIPFVLRENGRGFDMAAWMDKHPPGTLVEDLEVARRTPKCGTICCIGGSIQALKSRTWDTNGDDVAEQGAAYLGISRYNARCLFFSWTERWPEPYRTKLEDAQTAFQKAKIAAKFLERIAELGDAAFEPVEA